VREGPILREACAILVGLLSAMKVSKGRHIDLVTIAYLRRLLRPMEFLRDFGSTSLSSVFFLSRWVMGIYSVRSKKR
jgi:hypothetical protein